MGGIIQLVVLHAVAAIAVAGFGIKFSKETGVIMHKSKGQNQLTAGSTGNSGSSAKTLNTPPAQDPMAAVVNEQLKNSGLIGKVGAKILNKVPGGITGGIKTAGKVAGAIGKRIPGVVGAGMVAAGAVAAVGEAVDKKFQVRKKISANATLIANKAKGVGYRFTHSKFANGVKDGIGTIGSGINAAKNSVINKIPEGAKRKIRGVADATKFYSVLAKEKTKQFAGAAVRTGAEIRQGFIDTREMYKNEINQIAEGIENTKQAAIDALEDTKGRGVMDKGFELMGLQRFKSKNLKAKIEDMELQERRRRYFERFKQAVDRANKENENIAVDRVDKFLEKNTVFHSRVEEHIDTVIGKVDKKASQERQNAIIEQRQIERKRIINEIASNLDGEEATRYIPPDELDKLKGDIQKRKEDNVRTAIGHTQDLLIKEYREQNPNVDISKATEKIKEETRDIINAQMKQSQQPVAASTATSQPQQPIVATTPVSQTQQPASTSQSQQPATTATSSSTTSTERTNTVIQEKVVKEVVKEVSSPNITDVTKAITNDLAKNLKDEIKNNFENNVNGYLGKLDSEQINQLADAINSKGKTNNEKLLNDFYETIGGGSADYGKRYLSNSKNNRDKLNKMIDNFNTQEETNSDKITKVDWQSENKSKSKNKNRTASKKGKTA